MAKRVVVTDHTSDWAVQFQELRNRIWPVVSDIALAVEHVGSTSVPGLAAKPVIDLDILVETDDMIPNVIERLATLGYSHRGNLGIEGREAFRQPPDDSAAKHHLYLCTANSMAARNHLAFRDRLRSNAAVAQAYAALKKELARRFTEDIDRYIAGKTNFILTVLRQTQELSDAEISLIEAANREQA